MKKLEQYTQQIIACFSIQNPGLTIVQLPYALSNVTFSYLIDKVNDHNFSIAASQVMEMPLHHIGL